MDKGKRGRCPGPDTMWMSRWWVFQHINNNNENLYNVQDQRTAESEVEKNKKYSSKIGHYVS